MKKLHKNDMAVENTVVAYAATCICTWVASYCKCLEYNGSLIYHEEENNNSENSYFIRLMYSK